MGIKDDSEMLQENMNNLFERVMHLENQHNFMRNRIDAMLRVPGDLPNQTVKINPPSKPSTIRIGEYDVHVPMRKPLRAGYPYWSAELTRSACSHIWCDDEADHRRLELGVVYLTKEGADLCTEALRSLLIKPAEEAKS